MASEKPTDMATYKTWLREQRGVSVSGRTENHYRSVISKVREDFEKTLLWKRLTANLHRYNDEYVLSHQGYPLWESDKPPVLETKSFDSFLLKTFRKNVLDNANWPDPPPGDWILPDNWFSKIDDAVRTLLVVKYLDGVEFTMDALSSLSQRLKTKFQAHMEAREEGYYAAHMYIRKRFEIPRETWDTERVDVSIEIQITTQLQEAIRRLLHKYYEARRANPIVGDEKWQWAYGSDEFVVNYLGHILHYVEGMIMDVRKRQLASAKVGD
jgi:hypothetical protein